MSQEWQNGKTRETNDTVGHLVSFKRIKDIMIYRMMQGRLCFLQFFRINKCKIRYLDIDLINNRSRSRHVTN